MSESTHLLFKILKVLMRIELYLKEGPDAKIPITLQEFGNIND